MNMATSQELEDFLKPLQIDARVVHKLSLDLCNNFKDLAAHSEDQFLPTPISESILSHHAASDKANGGGKPGPYLAIDIGGTNLRVGFVELDAHVQAGDEACDGAGDPQQDGRRNVRRHLEQNWPIGEHLKHENAEALFAWIGARIAIVVEAGCRQFPTISDADALPMGVTFSFPMDQESLERATLRAMGKGFAITSRVDLGWHLLSGYEKARNSLPKIWIAAITNDAVATLVSFMHQFPPAVFEESRTSVERRTVLQRPAMGLICGTGSNATTLMSIRHLKESKRPQEVKVLPRGAGLGANVDGASEEVKIAVNTEWSIRGSAPPLRAHKLVSRWDEQLSAAVENPGFQPLEYMTAGRYLGELGRIMLVDYMTTVRGLDRSTFPAKLLREFEPRNTTFLSHYKPNNHGTTDLVDLLNRQFPPEVDAATFTWTPDLAEALYHIARAIEFRAAGLIAAATVGLLRCSDALPAEAELRSYDERAGPPAEVQLAVGYTGGCITNFQDYLQHCQQLLDEVADLEYPSRAGGGSRSRVRIVLKPCHDGGIDGAGILVPAAVASGRFTTVGNV